MPDYKGIPLNGGLDAPTGTGSQNIVLALKAIIDFLIGCDTPGILQDAGAVAAVDFVNRRLFEHTGIVTVDYNLARIFSASDGSLSADASARQTSAADGSISIDWQNRLLKNTGSLATIDYTQCFLYNPGTGSIAADWTQAHLSDSTGELSVDWQARQLFAFDGTTETLSWGAGLLIPGLPTADPGNPGQVWNNLGILSISI